MNVDDYQKTYYEYSGKASDICRTLALAGLAFIWLFKADNKELVELDLNVVVAAAWIIASLVLDLMQYLCMAAVWLVVSYYYERKYGKQKDDLSHSRWLPGIGEVIFAAKAIALLIGYWHIAEYILGRLSIK